MLQFIMLPLISIAQNNEINEYVKAKNAYEKQDYRQARLLADSFQNANKTHKHAPYALFLSAKSSAKINEYDIAIDLLDLLRQTYPDWENSSEIFLLKAECLFELGAYDLAFNTLEKNIKKEDSLYINKMKINYLDKMFDNDDVFNLYKKIEGDMVIAAFLYEKLMLNIDDTEIKNKLIEDFPDIQFSHKIYEDNQQYKKEHYTIAMIAPFYTNDIQNSQLLIGKDLILDFYIGLKKAVQHLNESRMDITLKVFDSKADDKWTKKLILSGVLNDIDTFVGPFNTNVYNELLPFCEKNKKTIINPFSFNQQRVKDNTIALNIQPSYQQMAQHASKLIKKHEEDTSKIMVIRGYSYSDNVLANSFLKNIEKMTADSLVQIYANEIVKPNDYKRIKELFYTEDKLEVGKIGDEVVRVYKRFITKVMDEETGIEEDVVDILGEDEEILETISINVYEARKKAKQEELKKKLKEKMRNEGIQPDANSDKENEEEKEVISRMTNIIPKDFNVLFVASENQILIANIIAALVARNDHIQIIGMEDWLLKSIASQQQLENLSVNLLHPKYLNYEKPSTQNFRNEYLESMKIPPNLNVYLGYETGVFLGGLLNDYGTYFTNTMDRNKTYPSTFFYDRKFPNCRESAVLPIVKLMDGKLNIILDDQINYNEEE